MNSNFYPNIKNRIIGLLFLFILIPCFSLDFNKDLLKKFNYARYNIKADKDIIELQIQNIAAVSAHYIILGGVYTTTTLPLHPVLFTSNDIGKTWQTIALNIEGAGISHIITCLESSIWVAVENQEEGALLPLYLLHSKNMGRNWNVYPLKTISLNDAIRHITFLKFYNEYYGLLTVTGNSGATGSFYSKNGGKTWKKLWKLDHDLSNSDIEYPDKTMMQMYSQKSTYTNIYNDNSENTKATIQFSKHDDCYIIEMYDYKTRQWIKLSRIPLYYQVDAYNQTLKPVDWTLPKELIPEMLP